MEQLIESLEQTNINLYKGLAGIEQEFMTFILEYVTEEFDVENGKIRNNIINRQKLISLRKAVIKAFKNKAATDTLQAYLADFDSVAELNIKLLENSITKAEFEKLTIDKFNIEKQVFALNVIDALSNKETIIDLFTPKVRQSLFESIALNRTLKQTRAKLKESIISDKNDSPLLRHIKTISKDSINQFSGAVQDKARELYQLDGFRYIGSLQDNSRSTCVNLVRGDGEYKDISLGGNKYRVSDIPKIIARSQDNDGWNPDTTIESFATLRGGYGCRHQVVFFRLLENER